MLEEALLLRGVLEEALVSGGVLALAVCFAEAEPAEPLERLFDRPPPRRLRAGRSDGDGSGSVGGA